MCSYYIIDKDKKTVSAIKHLVADFEDFRFMGTSDNEDDAMNTILKDTPLLVFINIDDTVSNPIQFVSDAHLYGMNEFIFIAISKDKAKAYDAIKMGCYDFLLSPSDELEIRKSILNFQKKKLNNRAKHICLKSYQDYRYLDINEILYLKADNNTTEFYLKDGRVVNGFKTLKAYGSSLPKEFTRIHKSYIVNTKYISRIQFGNFTCSIQRNKHSIPFSRSYIKSIKLIKNELMHRATLVTNVA